MAIEQGPRKSKKEKARIDTETVKERTNAELRHIDMETWKQAVAAKLRLRLPCKKHKINKQIYIHQ